MVRSYFTLAIRNLIRHKMIIELIQVYNSLLFF